MKCASEIYSIQKEVIQQHDDSIKQQVIKNHNEACRNAINFCENVIAKDLEKKAKNYIYKDNLILKYRIGIKEKDMFSNIHFNVFDVVTYQRTVRHRNGTKSKKQESCMKIVYENIDKNTTIAYLKKYCYDCSFADNYLTITLNPACN